MIFQPSTIVQLYIVTRAALPLEPRLKLMCTAPAHARGRIVVVLAISIYSVAAHDISLASEVLDVSLITTGSACAFSSPTSTVRAVAGHAQRALCNARTLRIKS